MKSSLKRLTALSIILAIALACLAAQPAPPPPRAGQTPPPPGQGPGPGAAPVERYTIEQSVSEKAQRSTIAFSALAFMTGSFGADTFLPPGKAADYFGFQYMRDIDAREAGHNQMFLGNIGNATLAILSPAQEALFLALAKRQEAGYQDLVKLRLTLIKAFRDNLEGQAPAGSKGLSQKAVQAYVADIFAIDGQLALDRAEVYSKVAASLGPDQKTAFSRITFGDSGTWPLVPEQYDKRSMSHGQDILYMTYASEFFSWYAGSEDADVYFCPERHGTYFGGFYMKDYPAMGNSGYFIPTALTGDSGEAFLALLAPEQAAHLTGIMTPLGPILAEILEIRRTISRQFRSGLSGKAIDGDKVMALSRRYGELDGLLSYEMATRFAAVYSTLTAAQKKAMVKLRNQDIFPKGYYLYSDPVDRIPSLDASALFAK